MLENLRAMKKTKKKRKLWSFFLDLKSAFDSVDHNIVFKKMEEKMGINEELIATVKWLYRQTAIKIGKHDIPIGKGVIQEYCRQQYLS